MTRTRNKRYHLIAIGGAVMHNVAIDLKDMGHIVTGSDDEIYEPSRSRLNEYGLLPSVIGWNADNIDDTIDAVILGKHARSDNPELAKAIELGIPIFSFPEFVKNATTATIRVCVAGSHGKTSTTSMIMHVLKDHNIDFDYLVGANIAGFDKMVRLSGADIIVVEADEYPSSCTDNRAKMLHYDPTISIITGIAWDHVNIYKTYDDYKNVFREYVSGMDGNTIVYFDQSDEDLFEMMTHEVFKTKRHGYLPYSSDKKGRLLFNDKVYPIEIFGRHNLLNLQAAQLVCAELGVAEHDFLVSMEHFTGAAKRLELIHDSESLKIYKDFAHAPSKCRATVQAIRNKYTDSKIRAVMELHTFSSLTPEFIEHYNGAMDGIDHAAVFYDPHAVSMKKMEALDKETVRTAFGTEGLVVFDDKESLQKFMDKSRSDDDDVILLMSSGNLGGFDLNLFVESLK